MKPYVLLQGCQERRSSFRSVYLLMYCTDVNEFGVIEHKTVESFLFK
jgi:hypothetical protein